jgi:hypothetical protein
LIDVVVAHENLNQDLSSSWMQRRKRLAAADTPPSRPFGKARK